MSDTATRIREKVTALADRSWKYGGKPHDFQLNAPLSSEAVRDIQAQYRLTLPEDYVRFLTELGDGGGGPGKGLLPLPQAIGEFRNLVRFFGSTPCQIDAAFPLSDIAALRSALLERPLSHDFPVDGMLPLCYWEEGVINVLSVSGEHRGRVWLVRPAGEGAGLWWPGGGTHQCPFLQWYEEWLDKYLDPDLTGRWRDLNRQDRLQTITLSVAMHCKSVPRVSFLEVVRLLPREIELLLSAVDAVLDAPLDREELDKLLQDITDDNIRDRPYVLFEGRQVDINVRTDPWGRELIFCIDPHLVDGFYGWVTLDRSMIHERIEDLLQAFVESYILNMDEGVDNDFLFRATTSRLLKWTDNTPQLRRGHS